MPYAELPGVRLHYEEAGAGPPLVLLHGIGASCRDWEYNIPAFAEHYRVIAPDLRGFGRSERSGNYGVATFAGDIWHLLEQLQVERFHLIGHSMGGAVALQMAVDRPQRIERLIAADTLPSFRTNTFGKRILFAYRYLMMGVLGPQRLSSAVAGKLFPGPHQQALRDRATAGGMANDRGVYLETLKQLLGWSVLEKLDRLIMPVLVLAAEHDYFPVTDAEVFAKALHDAHLKIFAGMHHAVPLEAPQAFNTAVLRFLSGRPVGHGARKGTKGQIV
ncbi:alpha/beta fold hydrolase [Nevskia soli]|uniref:alpha/beta fold hydrolase n=1 Tax=Nevskia soli TaxID=418856 RepID=UPI00068E187C|nr:alpha/beta hydrolase [Nevskia soli]